MSEPNKFTPGPWVVINRTGVFSELGAESGDGAKADPTDGWTIADCSAGCTLLNGDYVELGFAVQQANAKLIAAAPDLLEALEGVLRISDLWLPHEVEEQHGEEMYVLHMARNKMIAAVEKARGQQ